MEVAFGIMIGLEKDFDYARRGKLLGHGFSNERITEMLTDRWGLKKVKS